MGCGLAVMPGIGLRLTKLQIAASGTMFVALPKDGRRLAGPASKHLFALQSSAMGGEPDGMDKLPFWY
jgi:hypothetical protein